MTPALILACGNPLRGDDGLGGWMAAQVQEKFTSSQVEVVVASQQFTPELAEPISTADTVIFLDCSAKEEPGKVSLQVMAPAEKLPRLISHHMHPATLLRLSQELYGRVPRFAYLITVGGKSFKMGAQLSDAVCNAAPEVLSLVAEIVQGANTLRWNLPGSEQLVADVSELTTV